MNSKKISINYSKTHFMENVCNRCKINFFEKMILKILINSSQNQPSMEFINHMENVIIIHLS